MRVPGDPLEWLVDLSAGTFGRAGRLARLALGAALVGLFALGWIIVAAQAHRIWPRPDPPPRVVVASGPGIEAPPIGVPSLP